MQASEGNWAADLTGLLSRTVATVGTNYRTRADARTRDKDSLQWELSRQSATVGFRERP